MCICVYIYIYIYIYECNKLLLIISKHFESKPRLEENTEKI